MARTDLSLDEARRIALAAQGFARARPRRAVATDDLRQTIHRLGLLQIDYVNVLLPAQYQVLFSRLGPYACGLLDDLVYRRREFTEQWAHEASIVPVATWPLLRHRMAAFGTRTHGFEAFMERHRDYVDWVLNEIRGRGPVFADELPVPDGIERRIPGSWVGTVPRAILETYFGRGVLGVAARRQNFSRAYDLAERIVPAEHHGREMEHATAQRALLLQAARGRGVATATDLADYFRMSMEETKPRLAELVEAGSLRAVTVEGWTQPAYLHPEAQLPRRIEARALLSPFDPLVWHRPRVARLFGFDYRFEIFVPQAQRRWGSYVLPFLLGDRLVARVDIKADRPARRLRVLAAYREADSEPGAVAEALAAELRTMARWLGYEAVTVGRRGDFARALAAALRG